MARKTVKCRWKHCSHDSQDIPRDEAVKEGNNYYHADCLKEKHLVQKIKDTWAEKIDPNFDNMQLTVAINNLAFKHGMDLEYILFVVNEGADKKWLRFPNGLYQAVKDDNLTKKWRQKKINKEVGNIQDKLNKSSPPPIEYVTFDKEKKLTGMAKKKARWERIFA